MEQRSARGIAVVALREWRKGRQFADSILQHLLADSRLGSPDRGFATELFYGVLRNLTLLDFWIGLLRSGSLDAAARDLLRIGLYQLFFLHTPAHAAVFETTALASSRRRSLINALLRSALRRSEELTAASDVASLSIRVSHPQFLIDRWTSTFGDADTGTLCKWNNEPPPLYARVNLLKTSTEQFVHVWPNSAPIPEAPNFVRVTDVPIDALARGECYLQDPSTRIACELLDPKPGEDVLDACAAPGGKTGLLSELMENRGRLTACDREPNRVRMLQENLDQLGVTIAHVLCHDWQNGCQLPKDGPIAYDRILLDVPCSNTGVMRRRVDVRWRLSPTDFSRMPRAQIEILRSVLPLLKIGGSLVYSTCSLESEENEQVVALAVEEFPFLETVDMKTVLPFREGFDGSFAAKLIRTT